MHEPPRAPCPGVLFVLHLGFGYHGFALAIGTVSKNLILDQSLQWHARVRGSESRLTFRKDMHEFPSAPCPGGLFALHP